MQTDRLTDTDRHTHAHTCTHTPAHTHTHVHTKNCAFESAARAIKPAQLCFFSMFSGSQPSVSASTAGVWIKACRIALYVFNDSIQLDQYYASTNYNAYGINTHASDLNAFNGKSMLCTGGSCVIRIWTIQIPTEFKVLWKSICTHVLICIQYWRHHNTKDCWLLGLLAVDQLIGVNYGVFISRASAS